MIRVTMMIDAEHLFTKIDTEAIECLISEHPNAKKSIVGDTGFILIIRDDAYKFKQFNRWRHQGMTGYDILVPYEKAVSDDTTKEELTQICSDLIVECLLFWMEKERQKAEKERKKAEKIRAKAA